MLHPHHTIRATLLATLFLILSPALVIAMPPADANCGDSGCEPMLGGAVAEATAGGDVDLNNVVDCFYEEFAGDPLCAGTVGKHDGDVDTPRSISPWVAADSPEGGYVDPENVIDCFYEEFAHDPLCAGAMVGATL